MIYMIYAVLIRDANVQHETPATGWRLYGLYDSGAEAVKVVREQRAMHREVRLVRWDEVEVD